MKPHKELKNIKDCMDELLPEDHPNKKFISVVIHDRKEANNKPRDEFDDIVSMTLNDFIEIYKEYEKTL